MASSGESDYIVYFDYEILKETFELEEVSPVLANKAVGVELTYHNCDWKEVEEYAGVFNVILFSNAVPEAWRRSLTVSVLDEMLYQQKNSESLIDWESLLSDLGDICDTDRSYYDAFQLSPKEFSTLWLIYPFGLFIALFSVILSFWKKYSKKKKDDFFFRGFRAISDKKIAKYLRNAFLLFSKMSQNMISAFFAPIISHKLRKIATLVPKRLPMLKKKLKESQGKIIMKFQGKKMKFELTRVMLTIFAAMKKKKPVENQLNSLFKKRKLKALKEERENASIHDSFFDEFTIDVISGLLRFSRVTNYAYKPKLRYILKGKGPQMHTIIEIPMKKQKVRISKEFYMKEWNQKLFDCDQFWIGKKKNYFMRIARQSQRCSECIREVFESDELPLKRKVLVLLDQISRFEKEQKSKEKRSSKSPRKLVRIPSKERENKASPKGVEGQISAPKNEETVSGRIYEFKTNNSNAYF